MPQSGDDLTERLRKMITSGQFMPNQRLIETELAAMLSINRANIRTALGRLEQEGLVVCERNRGARVRLYTDEEAIEITQARAALESLVVAQAARRMTPLDKKMLRANIAQMADAVRTGDLITYSDLNGTFHGEIYRISGHGTATRLLATLRSQTIRFQYRAVMIPSRVGRSLQEHRAIAAALCAGDARAAVVAMDTHLQNVADALGRAIQMQRAHGT